MLAELVQRAERAFARRYGKPPTWITAAPGRVNLIGEHLDYNDGFVLPMAIERYVTIAAAPCTDSGEPTATFFSAEQNEQVEIPFGSRLEPRSHDWSSYVAGAIAGFLDRGAKIPAFEALIESNVPIGGGLSSSAALEVATATLLESLTGELLSGIEKALLCQRAEQRFAGVPCGIMDQFTSVFGRRDALLLLDCRSQQVRFIPFAAQDVTILIANSNVRHELAGGEYAKRRAQCDLARKKLGIAAWRAVSLADLEAGRDRLTATEFCRGRHIVSEIERTLAAAAALDEGDWPSVGEMMYASHRSLRDDFEVSCAELDTLVELALQIGESGGVFGSRLTGGGFGGCTVSLVKADRAESVGQSLAAKYQAATGITPTIFASRPARGTHLLRAANGSSHDSNLAEADNP